MRKKTNTNVRQYISIRLTKYQPRSTFQKPYWGHTIIIEACMPICGKWSQMTQLGFNFRCIDLMSYYIDDTKEYKVFI